MADRTRHPSVQTVRIAVPVLTHEAADAVPPPVEPEAELSDNADHCPIPPPSIARVVETAHAGRSVRAEAEIEEGDLIIDGEIPLVHAIEDESAGLGCHWSLARLDEDEDRLWSGEPGIFPVYATEAARDEAVASGGDAADVIFYTRYGKQASETVGNQDTAPLRMLCRILRLRDGNSEQRARYQKLLDLCGGENALDSDIHRGAGAVAIIAQSLLPADSDWDLRSIMEILFKCYCNTHGLTDLDHLQVNGIGLYDFGSRFNHSCNPNCCFYTRGNQLYVRALRDIEPGEELTISYCELYSTRASRLKKLYSKYSFVCQCDRCLNEENADRELCGYKCNAPGAEGKCQGTIPYFEACPPIREHGMWGTCGVCGATLPAKGDSVRDAVQTHIHDVEKLCSQIEEGDTELCTQASKLMGKLSRDLAPKNAAFLEVLLTASGAFLRAGHKTSGELTKVTIFMLQQVSKMRLS